AKERTHPAALLLKSAEISRTILGGLSRQIVHRIRNSHLALRGFTDYRGDNYWNIAGGRGFYRPMRKMEHGKRRGNLTFSPKRRPRSRRADAHRSCRFGA